ncbi:MAG: hypothetical protein HY902_00275 [Deltaproteobacteria bacterium]|nr:hypothetical protein [Deltaproteobacteria bacterium]
MLVTTAGGTGCTAETVPSKPIQWQGDAEVQLSADTGDEKKANEFTLLQTSPMDFGTGKACKADSDCPASFMPCYTAFCDPGKNVCNVKKIEFEKICNDGNHCTLDDHCQDGKCTGAALACDDGNPCTVDFCVATHGCTHGNLETPCQNDDVCTLHACKDGACVVVDTDPCNDGNPCTTDLCDPKAGCSYVALNNVPCDDGDSCTVSDFCKFGTCANNGSLCNDGNPCTDDACDSTGACLHTANANPCSDGKPCTILDTCNQGACAGTPKNCEDGFPCSIEACDPVTGACTYSPSPQGAACDDGNVCTLGDACDGYLCKGSQATCDDGNACTADSCAPASGCINLPLDEGALCSLGEACLAGAMCQLGECVGVPKSCDDANPCTVDACDAATGMCLQSPVTNGTPCGDSGTCYAGSCL